MALEKSRLRRSLSKWANSADQHARELRETYGSRGSTTIAEAPDRERVRLRGTLRTVTLRPRGGVPALEAELFDGSGAITLVWLGRRRIAGISPGPRHGGRGPDRRPGRRAGHVQPALRAARLMTATRTHRHRPTRRRPSRRWCAASSAKALGGRRGMVEAAVPTLLFTVTWLTTRNLHLALGVSVGAALLLLVVRLVQRSTSQFVSTPCSASASAGCSCDLGAAAAAAPTTRRWPTSCPGIIYNAGYTAGARR